MLLFFSSLGVASLKVRQMKAFPSLVIPEGDTGEASKHSTYDETLG
ncbi:hypothetical protein E2C01_063956 [Portunus trituberculatus]|uniref:Uncharacterized protein n=1 Tax=Portunus trituberculatus TaxID=210409 RepID=A0A5B7HJK1_PORTR|nr:hypothetical protein [Portunus trituberculatus]